MIKKYIPFSMKADLLGIYYKTKPLKSLKNFKVPKSKSNRIFIFLAADYGNLGDVAITYAQHAFLKKSFTNYSVTQIPISHTFEGIAFVSKIIHPTDIITTVGGGNMGDLYPMIEHYRQMVIRGFKKNQIISFPQTIDFSESKPGKKALAKAIKVYSKHPNLLLLAREQKSFDFFKTNFKKNKTLLVPDVVLTQDRRSMVKERSGAIICLRDDKEKKLLANEEDRLFKIVNKEFGGFKKRDTHIGGENLSLINRTRSLFNIWDDFMTAELVITDRLHGMIFCYITGTPALVFLNNNHKIKSSYKWIEDAEHINLVEDFSEEKIQNLINTLKSDNVQISKKDLVPFYDEFKKSVISK